MISSWFEPQTALPFREVSQFTAISPLVWPIWDLVQKSSLSLPGGYFHRQLLWRVIGLNTFQKVLARWADGHLSLAIMRTPWVRSSLRDSREHLGRKNNVRVLGQNSQVKNREPKTWAELDTISALGTVPRGQLLIHWSLGSTELHNQKPGLQWG